ncbi:MAG: hypothetical protein PHO14_03675 [Kiritimatiellae bacterium]|nr:hypothetical protein [Kiritimatiellia bacterium]MDD4341316.1 hypothetical protein [Kiritimatiellia bacterium]
MSDQIVVFEDWEQVMKETVPVALHGAYREAVVKCRYWLREKGGQYSIINIQYSMIKWGDGVTSPAGAAPAVQGWPTMGGRDINIQYSIFNDQVGAFVGRGYIPGAGIWSAPAVQGWPTMGGRDINIQYSIFNDMTL